MERILGTKLSIASTDVYVNPNDPKNDMIAILGLTESVGMPLSYLFLRSRLKTLFFT